MNIDLEIATTPTTAYGICEHCLRNTTLYFEINEDGEPVTTPLCAACENK